MPVSTLEKAMWETVQEGCYATGRAGGFVPRLGGHQKGQVWAIAATALLGQLEAALESLQDGAYDTISEYLQGCYTDNYVGTMHSLQQQGIPIITPIDQNQVVKAVQTDSKISKGLYTRLEEDVTSLKKNIAGEMSRGIATGSGWLEIATRIAGKMTNPFDKILSNAIRIARTEGHRIQQEAQLDALQSAKSAGADIVKQWDATLDARTRPDHQEADGQIVELDEEFTVGGEKLKAPGVGGSAKNVVNCRCCMLQRARWALDEAELETLKERAEFFGLDKAENFAEFKEKYLTATAKTNSLIRGVTGSKSVEDVTDEYISGAKPGVGTITYEQGYRIANHVEEVKVASWLNNILGGDMTLLGEINQNKIKSPDYIWRGKMWELKTISNAKAADTAVRKGLKQIAGNHGGIILDCSYSGDSLEETIAHVAYRLNRSSHCNTVDVLIMHNGALDTALRHKK